MTGPQSNKNYTAADIERYHNGSMSPEEAHALERAALDDPFLSDAIDGYVHTATPAADIAFLKQQFQSRSSKALALPNKNRFIWLRVAAMVVFVAGFGWMVYKLSGKTEYDSDMAVQTDAVPQSKAPSMPQQPAADSAAAGSEEMVTAAPSHQSNEEKAIVKKEVAAAKKAPEMPSPRALSNRDVAPDTTFSKPHAAPVATEGYALAKRAPARIFKARVVDTLGNAVPFATITQPGSRNATVADATGTFSITAPDSNLTVSVNAAGFDVQQRELHQSDSAATIALSRNEGQLNEVIVTGLGVRSKVRLEAVEPLGGWKKLNTYVAKNAPSPENDTEAPEGEVVLSFNVDKHGNATDISVETSLCPTCDSTAVRIIQEGSKWKKNKTAERAKAHIRF